MELRKIWEIIWSRKWIIIQAFLIISLTVIITSYLITPTYETSAKLLIEPSDTASSLLSSIGLSDFSSLISTQGETDTDTYMELVTIRPVLDEVILKLQLKDDDGNLMDADDLKESYYIISAIFPRPYVEVNQVEDTDLIEITASASDPEEAAMIANTLTDVYIKEDMKRRREEYRSAQLFIQEQISTVKAEYLNALEEIKTFQIREQTIALDEEIELALEKMGELMKEKEDNIIDISETRAKIETLKAQLSRQSEMMVSSSTIAENPQIEDLKKTLTALELELTEALMEKTRDHIDVITLKQKIKKAREELKKEVDIFQESSRDLETLERELAALEAHLKGVNADIDKYLSLLYTLPEKSFTQSQLKLKLTASQGLYSTLLEYLSGVGIGEAMAISDVRLVEPAIAPDIDEPEIPNIYLNIFIGLFSGLIFGLGLAFLVDYLDDTVKTPDDAREHSGFTMLGMIPRFKKKESVIISERDPKDPIYESYRTLRNSIKFASLDKPINSLLITSSLQGEGKTITTINLAISITREGKKVLILDGDLRRPQIHDSFRITNSPGITNILSGEVKIEDAVKETDIPGLSILTSGPTPPDPGQMVETEKMHQLIKYLIKQYDFVLVDSPPMLIANDAMVLTGYTDGSIMILESKKLTIRALSQVKELLKNANIQPIGVILNKFTVDKKSGYYYYYYKSNYYEGQQK